VFLIANLKPSTYTVRAQKEGLAPVEYTQMTIAVGQELHLDFEFKPSGVQEAVTVVGEAPILDLSSARMGANVSERDVVNLPVNGRQMSQLLYNALQVGLSRRSANRLSLNAQYTLARSFGNTSGSDEALTAGNPAQTPAELDYDLGYNAFDVRHTFNFSALYSVPYGRGRRYTSGITGARRSAGGRRLV
jgi:hypothetical protein